MLVGTTCPDTGSALSDPADQGRLLSALNALRVFRPAYASAVNAVFTRSKSAEDTLASQVRTDADYYSYLVAEGFAAFGYDESATFNALDNYPDGGAFLPIYGQSLPKINTLSEPLAHAILEREYLVHSPSARFLDFANRVYLAQSGRFSSTALLTAWTEGGYPNPPYIYQWIIIWGQTWKLSDATGVTTYNVQPFAYAKVALSYLAIYGENSYTLALANAAKQLTSSQGFGEASFETGASAITAWGNQNGFYSDKTNEFVLAAAVRALSQPTTTGTTTSSTTTTPPSSGYAIGNMAADVFSAPANNVWFVLPDYNGPYHASASKCGGRSPAQLSDYSAGGYILGLLTSPQNQILDTNGGKISQTDCGNPVGISGGAALVALAGPGANEVTFYYEQVAQITPVYFLWDGANNLVVRATGQKLTYNTVALSDYFVIQAVSDGVNRKVFIVYGFSWQGTLAAAVFFNSYVYPKLSQYAGSWYVYQWSDAGSGSSANSFPDTGDVFNLVASSTGSAPSQTPPSGPTGGTALSGFASIEVNVFRAAANSVFFGLPDYSGPYHTPASKCGSVAAAALSDYSAGGYLLSGLSNPQNQILDTSSLASSNPCGQFLGAGSTLVLLAGPGVNTFVSYYEKGIAVSPVYFLWDGSRNSFVVRATGAKYTVPPQGSGNTVAGNDLFLLETFVDQGRRVYVIYGFSWQGTLAAAVFIDSVVRSNLSQFTNTWYIYEWKDAASGSSANSFPDPGDLFNLQASSGISPAPAILAPNSSAWLIAREASTSS